MPRRPSLLLTLALLLAAAPAAAHVRLTSPVSRYGDEMKSAPCGRLGGLRTANVTTFAPGQVIEVTFDEIIDHPGYYRIAFDPAGEGALSAPLYDGAARTWSNPAGVTVLADRIPDAAVGPTRGVVQVTLPDVECQACTLQLIQVMTDKPPFDGGDDFYYQCADLVLSRTPDGPPPPPPPPPSPPLASDAGGGCATGGGTPWPLALLLASQLLLRRPGPRGPTRR